MFNIDKRTEKRKVGDIGENIACGFLKSKGFEILEKNYLRKWGEIDVVAKKNGVVHFIEVKSACLPVGEVNHETGTIRPEENMHPGKMKRLRRTIETYLLHRKLECDFQLDLVTVKMNSKTREARVELFENIIT